MVVDYVIHRYTEDSPVDENGWSVLVSGKEPDHKIGEIAWIEAIGRSLCCSDMVKHYALGDVEFGTRPRHTYRNQSTEVFLRVARGPEHDIPLPYCPWCTQPVTTNCVKDAAKTHG